MDKHLEEYLWENIAYIGKIDEYHCLPREVIDQMVSLGMIKSPKQAWATLEKWTRQGIYGYGTSLDLGWKIKDE